MTRPELPTVEDNDEVFLYSKEGSSGNNLNNQVLQNNNQNNLAEEQHNNQEDICQRLSSMIVQDLEKQPSYIR